MDEKIWESHEQDLVPIWTEFQKLSIAEGGLVLLSH